MKEPYKPLLKAPWSNQKVGPFVRVLAWVVVVCSFFALSAMVYFAFVEGVPREAFLFFIVFATLIPYVLLLFGRVALTGKAPEGWIPWK